MKRSNLIAATAVLALGSVFLYAAKKEFWESKPYTEWTEKEADKLLKESPWAKTIPLSVGPEDGMSGGGRRNPEEGGATGGAEPYRERPRLVVRWFSKAIRQAQARLILLRNPEPPKEQLDRLLNRPETPYYDLVVEGWNPGRNRSEGVKQLKEETVLQKKNKEKLALKDAIVPQKRGDPLVLRFAREVDGKPSLTLEDKEVQLHLKMGDNTIRVPFKLSDMVINGELALH